jgi:energy-coupling factor transporter ATP-binding protein EcfA2
MNRLPETRTLYELLPQKSAASGKEFARVVNLLLFHDARSRGENLALFDDRAGDYFGLDAFRKEGQKIPVGYQHKFFPSPLSDKHRQEIEESLAKTQDGLANATIDLLKWVLVTPQDPVESATRNTGGDVTWFAGLKQKYKIPFEIEHWGHTQLQALFINTPAIGLFYYPELFPYGRKRQASIQQLRLQYDAALQRENGRIEFVGMSVYKQETARTVPMENIYIPLAIVPEGASDEEESSQRHTPFDLLELGSRHVILGDPGSGKTTLMRFLALVGKSHALQQRYRQQALFQEDNRLPVLITLRRYADALKKDDNISLIDFLRTNLAADFSMAGLSLEFLEYHLETGQTILLFDGLDELPTPDFKHKVRNRIQHFAERYPGNTTLVTSRIYGYQGSFQFDREHYRHHRLAKLGMEEIRQFVHDWYAVRVERAKDRRDYMDSLLSILANPEHVAIRELARNPLLLTIIVLVHRIDAVLPDERHVLYQKCTETLLNTWHTWKFHEMDRLHKAKVDRLNMQRMQALAYWMQQRMGSTEAGRQAVVPYEELHAELARHIDTERPPNPDYAAEDIATAFLEFVQDRAGLLVEIGDRHFSFVHLTFQEFLTAGHIKTFTEPLSLQEAWQGEIAPHCADPRWREVIRLLVASYGANRSQELLIDWMLALPADPQIGLLLGGLYLDGVAAAKMKLGRILGCLLETSVGGENHNLLAEQLGQLRACLAREPQAQTALQSAAGIQLEQGLKDAGKTRLRLVLLACGLAVEDVWRLCGKGGDKEFALVDLFFSAEVAAESAVKLENDLDQLRSDGDAAFLQRASGCYLAVVGWSCINRAGLWSFRPVFHSLLATLVYSPTDGPLLLITRYGGMFATALGLRINSVKGLDQARGPDRDQDLNRDLGRDAALAQALARARDLDRDLARAPAWAPARALALAQDGARDRARALARAQARGQDLDRDRDLDLDRHRLWQQIHIAVSTVPLPYTPESVRSKIWEMPTVLDRHVGYLAGVFDPRPAPYWQEALKFSRVRDLPDTLPLFDTQVWQDCVEAFRNNDLAEERIWQAACLLFLESALYFTGFLRPNRMWLRKALNYTEDDFAAHKAAAAEVEPLFTQLADLTRDRPEPALRIVHCLRALAYGDEDESRADELASMVSSTDPAYRQIFVDSYWLPTEAERLREETERQKRGKKKPAKLGKT